MIVLSKIWSGLKEISLYWVSPVIIQYLDFLGKLANNDSSKIDWNLSRHLNVMFYKGFNKRDFKFVYND